MYIIICITLTLPPRLQNSGMLPLDSVRDPRIGRLWTKYKETDLPVPTFKVAAFWRIRATISQVFWGGGVGCQMNSSGVDRHTPLRILKK